MPEISQPIVIGWSIYTEKNNVVKFYSVSKIGFFQFFPYTPKRRVFNFHEATMQPTIEIQQYGDFFEVAYRDGVDPGCLKVY